MTEGVERQILALPRGNRRVYLSWRLLSTDAKDENFYVERRRPGGQWRRVSQQPVLISTDYLDEAPEPVEYEYRILARGKPSRPVCVNANAPATNLAVEFPLLSDANQTLRLAAGDLDNDGRLDFVTGYRQGGRFHLRAYRIDGKPLWNIDTGLPGAGGWDGSPLHVPFACWDINGDGRTEVVFHKGPGLSFPDNFYQQAGEGETLTAVDGETGETVWECPWPAAHPRVMLTVGHIQGIDEPPAVVVLDGTYGDVVLTAVDGIAGKVLWQVEQKRPAGHNLDVADVNEDGIQEVIAGGCCYRGDGSLLWEAEEFGHTDISKPGRFRPDRPGLQIFYAVESKNPGAYLVDCKGRTLWYRPFDHAHFGWIARYETGVKGLMPHVAEKSGNGYYPVFYPDGRHWRILSRNQARRFVPVQWQAGEVTVFARRDQKRIVHIDAEGNETAMSGSELPAGGIYGRNQVCLDILGDFREELVGIDRERGTLFVAANPEACNCRELSPMEEFNYRHDRSQHASGYYIYTCPPILQ